MHALGSWRLRQTEGKGEASTNGGSLLPVHSPAHGLGFLPVTAVLPLGVNDGFP